MFKSKLCDIVCNQSHCDINKSRRLNIENKTSENKQVRTTAAVGPQVLISFLVDIVPFLAGLSTGFIGIFLPEIRNEIKVSLEQGSWIASLSGLGSIPGCLLSAWTCEMLGRKRTLQLSTIPFISGWSMVAFASSVDMIYVGRFSTGFGLGVMSGCKQVYLSEICDTRLRGFLSSTTMTATNIGILAAYLLALGVSWRNVAISGMSLSVAALLSYFIFIPETPTWLVTKGKEDEAMDILKKVRGKTFDVNSELDGIVRKHKQNKEETEAVKGNWKQSLALYFSPQTLKAFGILFILFFTQRYSGSPVITNYIKDIFDTSSSGGTIDGSYVAIFTGVIRVVLTIISNFLLQSVRKKVLYAVSGTGMTVSLFTMATYYYLAETSDHDIGYPWIPSVCVCLFIAFVTPGFFTASWVLLGELFPQRTRGTMSSVLSCVGYALHFSAVKTYPDLLGLVHSYGVFWIYGIVSLLGTVLVILILPDTKDKTLIQIEDELTKQEDTKHNNESKDITRL